MARAFHHMHEIVNPRPMAQRRGIKRGVVGAHRVDIDEIAQRHQRQHTGGLIITPLGRPVVPDV